MPAALTQCVPRSVRPRGDARRQEAARRIARVSNESKLQVDEEEYVNKFRPELMDVVYQWAKGAKFAQIIQMTDVFEGAHARSGARARGTQPVAPRA